MTTRIEVTLRVYEDGSCPRCRAGYSADSPSVPILHLANTPYSNESAPGLCLDCWFQEMDRAIAVHAAGGDGE